MRSRDNLPLAALAACAAMLSCLAGPTFAAIAVTELRFAHFGPQEHPSALAAQRFADQVFRRSRGSLKVLIIGGESDVLEQIEVGVVDMGLVGWDALAKHSRYAGAVGIPFAFANYAQAHRAIDGPIHRFAAAELEPQGLVLLDSWEWGFEQIATTTRRVTTAEDLKGLKLAAGSSFIFSACMNAFGAQPVPLPFTELNPALQSHMVDGQQGPIAVLYDRKLFKTQRHVALLGYIYTSMVHVVRRSIWESLSKDQQAILREESWRAASYARRAVESAELQQIDDMKKAGVDVTRPDPSSFKKALAPVYEQLREQIGNRVFDRFIHLSVKP
jgi:tripartite ATP-independent transporter DctP family solute receptor